MKPKYRRAAVSGICLVLAIAAAPLSCATDFTFTGTTVGTTTWSSGTYWDAVPVSGSTTGLVFGTGQTLPSGVITNQDIASPPFLLNSLTTGYGSGTSNFVIQGSALNFVSNGATTPTIVLNSTAQLQMSSAVNFGNNTAISGAKDILFTGAITNTGGAVVTKSGAGTMRIASDNAGYTGDFNVTGGTLQVGNNSPAGDAGSGTVTLSGGGSFVVRRNSGTLALNNTITGTGNVKFQTRNFTATINKANTYIGTTTLEPSATDTPGGIKLGIDNGLPSGTAFTINNNGTAYQTFNLNGFNQTLGSIATGAGGTTTNSIITNSGAARTLTVSNSSGSTTYAGLISGNIALTKSGASTQVLSGANTYNGATTVSGGVLQVDNGSALGSSAAGTVVNGSDGSLNFVGTVVDLNGVTVSSESLTLDSGTTANNRVTLRSVGSTTNTWAGGVSLLGSKSVQLSANNGQLTLSGAITQSSFTGSLNLRGAGSGTLSGGVALSGTTTIFVNDGGTWNINTSGNTWGNTNVINGNLVLGATNALPSTTSLTLGSSATSGALTLNGKSQTVAGLTISGSGTANKVVGGSATAGALTVNNSTSNVFAGVLGGTGANENNFSLTKSGAGTLTLSGANTYTGATNVTAGTLAVNGIQSAATGTVTVSNGATLSGTGTIGGATMIESGGHLAAGSSPGILNFSDSLAMVAGSVFEWDLAANSTSGRGTNFDGVNVTATITIDSGVSFRVIQNLGLNFNDVFWDSDRTWNNIFNAGTLNSNWSNAAVSVFDTSGLLQDVSPFGSFAITGGTLNWTAVPEPGTALVGGILSAALSIRRRRSRQ